MDKFRTTVWDHYAAHGRHELPWRKLPDDTAERFYRVLVSEIMLQQTGVTRVIAKYHEWIEVFPLLSVAAKADFQSVLALWHGLGYNRRALYLYRALQHIHRHGVPADHHSLCNLPGVGPNTAGAIMAYAFNKPSAFIETNIRTVFIHHFFDGQSHIDDKDIIKLVQEASEGQEPRQWYWALMDYGSHLKKTTTVHRRSAHYKKQSPFEGSLRQLRAKILRLLTSRTLSYGDLTVHFNDERTDAALKALINDGLIHKTNGLYGVSGGKIDR